jgi:site-specific recombinase XerD
MHFSMSKWNPRHLSGRLPVGLVRPAGLPVVYVNGYKSHVAVNAWLLELSRSTSRGTWLSYGRAMVQFANFLASSSRATDVLGPDLIANGDAALRAYAISRTRPDLTDATAAGIGDARSTIAKRRAALLSFYTFAVQSGRLDRLPFTTRTSQTRYGEKTTLAFLAGGRITPETRDPIPQSQLDRFLMVGVLGQTANGASDLSFLAFATKQRQAAGLALSLAAGLRHQEVLHFTHYELPKAHADGLSPMSVAGSTTKGRRPRPKVLAFSEHLMTVDTYVTKDRKRISRRATWWPANPLVLVPRKTNQWQATFTDVGVEQTWPWGDVTMEMRHRLVEPGGGSPLLLLNHRTRDGAPLINESTLANGMKLARERCSRVWPEESWNFSMHTARHTYATNLVRFLHQARNNIALFEAEHGRRPVWAELALNESPTLLVQESLGHASPASVKTYTHTALWELLMSVNADPDHNPALSMAS